MNFFVSYYKNHVLYVKLKKYQWHWKKTSDTGDGRDIKYWY